MDWNKNPRKKENTWIKDVWIKDVRWLQMEQRRGQRTANSTIA